MFNFLQTIFTKVTSVIITVLVTVGLMSAPVVPEEPPELRAEEQIVIEEVLEETESNQFITQEETEIEKLREKIEELKKASEPVIELVETPEAITVPQYTPPVQQIIPPEDTALKIAQCEAKRDKDFSEFTVIVDQAIQKGVDDINAIYQTKKDEQFALYDTCKTDWTTGLQEYSMDATCGFYIGNIEDYQDYYKTLVDNTKNTRESTLLQGKQVVDDEYYQCIKA